MANPTQRLILLFDGTWNDPQDRTNVYRLARDLHDHDDHGVRQGFFYEPGVGTRQWERLTGGAFGWGLSRNLQIGLRLAGAPLLGGGRRSSSSASAGGPTRHAAWWG